MIEFYMKEEYKLSELTPENMLCGVCVCPGVYVGMKDNYLIIGKIEKAEEFGLEKKVGEGETLISVPKGLIDNVKGK